MENTLYTIDMSRSMKNKIIYTKIESAEQLGNIFTKGLGRVAFKHLRKKLMGW